MASSSVAVLALCLLAVPAAAVGHLRAARAGGIAADAAPCEIPPGMQKVKLTGTKGGVEMVLRKDHDILSEKAAVDKFWEVHGVDEMAHEGGATLPEKKGVFLDIGGNLGYYSFLFASEGWRVITIEPMTDNRRAFNATLCLNPHLKERITLVPAALGTQKDVARGGCVLRPFVGENLGNGILNCGGGPAAACKSGEVNCETVPMRTLDDVLAELKPPSVDVMKMDVEGFECNVMAGGESLLQKYHPHLLKVETRSNGQSSYSCMKKVTDRFGYTDKTIGTETNQDTYFSLAAAHGNASSH